MADSLPEGVGVPVGVGFTQDLQWGSSQGGDSSNPLIGAGSSGDDGLLRRPHVHENDILLERLEEALDHRTRGSGARGVRADILLHRLRGRRWVT